MVSLQFNLTIFLSENVYILKKKISLTMSSTLASERSESLVIDITQRLQGFDVCFALFVVYCLLCEITWNTMKPNCLATKIYYVCRISCSCSSLLSLILSFICLNKSLFGASMKLHNLILSLWLHHPNDSKHSLTTFLAATALEV